MEHYEDYQDFDVPSEPELDTDFGTLDEVSPWGESLRSEFDCHDELHERRLKIDGLKQGVSWRAATPEAIQRIDSCPALEDEVLSPEDQALAELIEDKDLSFWLVVEEASHANDGELDEDAAHYFAERAQAALRPKFSAPHRGARPRSMAWRSQHGCHGRHRRASRPAPVRHRGSRRSATRGSPSSDDPDLPPRPVDRGHRRLYPAVAA